MWANFSGDRLLGRNYSDSISFSRTTPCAVAILFTSLAACSWIAVPGVHARGEYRDETVARDCTDSYAAPHTDAAVSVLSALLAINGLRHMDDGPGSPDDPIGNSLDLGGGILGGVMLMPYTLSAFHGYRHVGRCRTELRKPPRD